MKKTQRQGGINGLPGQYYSAMRWSNFERQLTDILKNGLKPEYLRFTAFFEGRASVFRRGNYAVFILIGNGKRKAKLWTR